MFCLYGYLFCPELVEMLMLKHAHSKKSEFTTTLSSQWPRSSSGGQLCSLYPSKLDVECMRTLSLGLLLVRVFFSFQEKKLSDILRVLIRWIKTIVWFKSCGNLISKKSYWCLARSHPCLFWSLIMLYRLTDQNRKYSETFFSRENTYTPTNLSSVLTSHLFLFH